jgi:hypothetical protein
MKQKTAMQLLIIAATLQAMQPAQARTDFNLYAGCGECEDFDLPTVVTGFNTDLSVENGGINAVYLLKKTAALADETVQAQWQAALDAGDMRGVSGCFGQGGLEAEPQVEELGACIVEALLYIKNTITFTDIEDNPAHERFQFWRALQPQNRRTCFLLAFQTCDGTVYPFRPVVITPVFSIADQKTGKKAWTVTFKWDEVQTPLPLDLTWSTADLDLTGL